MWQLLGFWLAALTCLAHAASEGAGLWLYQPKTTGWGSARTISPDTARLLIASRLGLDSFLDLATQDEQALRNINELGGKQQLFAGRLNDEPVAFVLANGLRAEDIGAHSIFDGTRKQVLTLHQRLSTPMPLSLSTSCTRWALPSTPSSR